MADEGPLLRQQEAMSGLADLYRWALRIGVVAAIAGLVASVATQAGRRTAPPCCTVWHALLAVLSRVLLLALVDATTWPVEGKVNYILPATDYLVLFVLLGCWSLARLALGHRRQNERAAADETDGADETDRADRGAPVQSKQQGTVTPGSCPGYPPWSSPPTQAARG